MSHSAVSTSRWLTAAHAGTSYPKDAATALDYFRGFFDEPETPAWPLDAISDQPPNAPLAGIITPHIDFLVSQSAYAHAFAPWFHAPPAETYLILGVGHRSYLEWNLGQKGLSTPLGKVKPDTTAIKHLAAAMPTLLEEPRAHEGEHSIEFPAVLLQAWHKLRKAPPFRIVPLLCGSLTDYVCEDTPPHKDDGPHHLAATLEAWLADERAAGRRVQIIVSIDGCHIGPRFQHRSRVNDLLLHDTALWEQALWTHAEAGDFANFVSWLRQEGNIRHFDGVGALGLLLLMNNAPKIHRTHYEQWFEPMDHSVVTFSGGWLQEPGG